MKQLDPEVVKLLVGYGIKFAGALITLALGWVLAGWTARLAQKHAEKTARIEITLSIVLGKVVRVVILVITMIAVLNWFGVQTSSLVALVGAAGLTIGLALQGALSNVAAGVMLLTFRPFKVGDFVNFGEAGVVDEIGLFITRMHSPDNIAMMVPNSKIWGNAIMNFSQNATRRIDLTFGISYGDDMNKAVRIITEVIAADPRCLKEPAPLIAVAELGDSAVSIWARPWVNRTDFLTAKLDITRRVKERFDMEDITIPFPQRDVHLYPASAAVA